MIALVAAVLLATEPASPASVSNLGDAVQAMKAGRLDQAQLIIDVALRSGVAGEDIDRLRAELAFRRGQWADASVRYQQLALRHPDETLTLERAGIAALHVGDLVRASTLLKAATALPGASWSAWNARGAAADRRHDWDDADLAYERASQLQGDRPEVLNNCGWSLLLRGRWAEALPLLERAASLDPKSQRTADNLELARAAMSQDLPARRAGESDSDWAARLNDAGVLAMTNGDQKRAIAAFAQAIEASPHWFDRAANNLAQAQSPKP